MISGRAGHPLGVGRRAVLALEGDEHDEFVRRKRRIDDEELLGAFLGEPTGLSGSHSGLR